MAHVTSASRPSKRKLIQIAAAAAVESFAFFENRPIFQIRDIRESSDVASFRRFLRSTSNDYMEFIDTTLLPYQRRWADLVEDLPICSPLMKERAEQLRAMASPHAPNAAKQELFTADEDAPIKPIVAYVFCSRADAETYFTNRSIGGNGKLIVATDLRPDKFWSSEEEILEMHNKLFPGNYSNLTEFECYVAICISDAFEERVNTTSTVRFWHRCGSQRIAYDLLMVGARRLHDAQERGVLREVMQEVVDKHIVLA
ncbi:hypothetical protein G6L46_30495 [Agrobacterium rhizogenes]|uniref:RolB family protein n=1 Tax=Rhizobium rhizogenes TaxID=359 RepID=UPI001573DE97|nr:RolB family protein [Rhizobium rhizogenes]NTF91499.1 hypothetical protein [Rhizobium rhizogenes]